VRIVVAVTIMAAVTAWFAWVAWFMHRTATYGKHHHTIPPARVAAHHPLPVVDTGPDTETWPAPRRTGELYDLDAVAAEFGIALPVRHTHRDPTTGRYTRSAGD